MKQLRIRIGEHLGADSPEGRVMITISNYLTLTRLLIIPLFWLFFFSASAGMQILATALFGIGALTDIWDGKIARRRGQVTAFGNFMDPLADKLLVLSAFWAILIREDFGNYGTTAVIWIGVITLREVALTVKRIVKVSGGSALVTSLWGKWKTATQLVAILFALVLFNARSLFVDIESVRVILGKEYMYLIINILMFISMVTSLISGWLYFKPVSSVGVKVSGE